MCSNVSLCLPTLKLMLKYLFSHSNCVFLNMCSTSLLSGCQIVIGMFRNKKYTSIFETKSLINMWKQFILYLGSTQHTYYHLSKCQIIILRNQKYIRFTLYLGSTQLIRYNLLVVMFHFQCLVFVHKEFYQILPT